MRLSPKQRADAIIELRFFAQNYLTDPHMRELLLALLEDIETPERSKRERD